MAIDGDDGDRLWGCFSGSCSKKLLCVLYISKRLHICARCCKDIYLIFEVRFQHNKTILRFNQGVQPTRCAVLVVVCYLSYCTTNVAFRHATSTWNRMAEEEIAESKETAHHRTGQRDRADEAVSCTIRNRLARFLRLDPISDAPKGHEMPASATALRRNSRFASVLHRFLLYCSRACALQHALSILNSGRTTMLPALPSWIGLADTMTCFKHQNTLVKDVNLILVISSSFPGKTRRKFLHISARWSPQCLWKRHSLNLKWTKRWHIKMHGFQKQIVTCWCNMTNWWYNQLLNCVETIWITAVLCRRRRKKCKPNGVKRQNTSCPRRQHLRT